MRVNQENLENLISGKSETLKQIQELKDALRIIGVTELPERIIIFEDQVGPNEFRFFNHTLTHESWKKLKNILWKYKDLLGTQTLSLANIYLLNQCGITRKGPEFHRILLDNEKIINSMPQSFPY